MAGITTSESMAGEQPKDDNLGSRVDELTNEVDKLRNELSEFQNYVTVWRSEFQKYVLDSLEALEKKNVTVWRRVPEFKSEFQKYVLDSLEALEKKNSDGR